MNHLLSFVLSLVLSLDRERLIRLFEHCVWASALFSLLDTINELDNTVPPRGTGTRGVLLFEGVE